MLPHGRCPAARTHASRVLHTVCAPVRNVCARGASTCATRSRRWAAGPNAVCTRARPCAQHVRMGGDHLRELGRQVHAPPCAHGYRAAGATLAGLCVQNMHDRRATPAGLCVQGMRDWRATPTVMCMRDARTIPRSPTRFARTVRDGSATAGGGAPGFDQFHGEIGTSTIERLRPPNPVHDQNLNSFADLYYKTDESFMDGISSPERSEQIPTAAAGGDNDGGGGGEERKKI
ncbi:hypothetical protein F511_34897 [Dorcoceras hygrometricum]|uniref:Uncharacterized protein n=1 Tax=Dorcoceras hygrometricum TaxID=472368 RepID=A0A2Z7B543_9LAMI|nr:hypothetical protein F511_34897 [Dorcoceras hygrometricum]